MTRVRADECLDAAPHPPAGASQFGVGACAFGSVVLARRLAFARLLTDGATLAVRVDLEEREALLAVAPDVFFLTPHCEGWPRVLVRLARIERADLEERLVEAWRFMAPPKLLREFDASH